MMATAAVRTILSLFISQTLQQEMGRLSPPHNVMLTSENFFTFLTWEPAVNATNDTQYEAERRASDSPFVWNKVTTCGDGDPTPTHRCELLLLNLTEFYQARVRAKDRTGMSSAWTYSSWLQPYKDTVVGPFNLSLTASDYSLSVSTSALLTPLKQNGTYLSVQQLLPNVKCVIILSSGEVESQTKSCRLREMTGHTFGILTPNTKYCIKVKATDQPTKEAVQCIKTPNNLTGDSWIRLVITVIIVFVVMLSIIVLGLVLFRVYRQRSQLRGYLPKSLTFPNQQPDVNLSALRTSLCLKADAITSLSAVVLPSDTNTATELESKRVQKQLISAGSLAAQESNGYWANGFDQGNWNRADCLLQARSGTAVDTHPLGELDEYSADRNYRTALDVGGFSVQLPPSSSALQPHDLCDGSSS